MKVFSANLVFRNLSLESDMNAQNVLSSVYVKNANLKSIMNITYLRSKRFFLNNKRKKLMHIASKNGLAMDIMVMVTTDIDMATMDMEDPHLKANRNVKVEGLIGLLKNAKDFQQCLVESPRITNHSLMKTKV